MTAPFECFRLTDPTELVLAIPACHVVASRLFLDAQLAVGTLIHILFTHAPIAVGLVRGTFAGDLRMPLLVAIKAHLFFAYMTSEIFDVQALCSQHSATVWLWTPSYIGIHA